MTLLVAVRSLRVLLGPDPTVPARRGIAGQLLWFTPRRSPSEKVLETIQETGVPFGIVSRVVRRLGIATESLQAQGREEQGYGGADAV
jgi:hypothetical protein